MTTRILTSLVVLSFVAACGDNQTVPPDHQDYLVPDAGQLACLPNLDGQIDANELQAAIGISESLLVSPAGQTRNVDLTGNVDGAGKRTWDFSVDDGSDQLATIQAMSLDGKWYASSFPNGQWAAPLDVADTLEGVYTHSDTEVDLLGIASTQPNPSNGQTLYVYDAPVEIYRFPLTPGASWTSVGQVHNGTFDGLPYASTDTYNISVDSAGTLILPDVTFTQAMRVKTTVTVVPIVGQTVTTQQSSWLFECFGEVARATSQLDETNPDFTTAAEVRRLSLQRSTP